MTKRGYDGLFSSEFKAPASTMTSAPLTPELFAEGIQRLREAMDRPPEPRSIIVGPRAYRQAQTWRADARYAKWLSRAMRGSDHAASLEPQGFALMTREIRAGESADGDGVKRVTEGEALQAARLRRKS